MSTVIQKLKILSPHAFENLTYDLLVRRGMSNVRWRTPGADGGRDLEGDISTHDFAGDVLSERWYVECKRYSSAIDWPTVREKIAYAENHNADYLLLVTTSNLSPNCRTEVASWNGKRRRPMVRDWPAATFVNLVARDPLLLVKYGLKGSTREIQASALPLLTLASKAIHQVYGEMNARGVESPSLEFAASISELAATWLHEASSEIKNSRSQFDLSKDLYPWCIWAGARPTARWHPMALRSILTAIRFFGRASNLKLKTKSVKQREIIEISPDRMESSKTLRSALDLICQTGNLEWESANGIVDVYARS